MKQAVRSPAYNLASFQFQILYNPVVQDHRVSNFSWRLKFLTWHWKRRIREFHGLWHELDLTTISGKEQQEEGQIKDQTTVHTILFPVLGAPPQS